MMSDYFMKCRETQDNLTRGKYQAAAFHIRHHLVEANNILRVDYMLHILMFRYPTTIISISINSSCVTRFLPLGHVSGSGAGFSRTFTLSVFEAALNSI
ncbi:hypothetical protein CEP53_002124 [Fusarium sp. AF-6]|nr:hypothetical protein CEP53_002124 [Fusarium sp. AF-6]